MTTEPDDSRRADGVAVVRRDDLQFAGVAGQAAAIASGEISSRDLVAAALERIQRHDRRLNAFTAVSAERALAEAEERDAHTGERGRLHGVPIAVKDEVDIAGEVTTFGGRGNRSSCGSDSELGRRLRAAGAVIVGKTTMPEFGQWPVTESSTYGITRNPWDLDRSPGGSSGGTAAAVAAGLVPAGIGGDGGGSIRIPSAFCGLYGLKPQRGRVSTAPAAHLWWALGTVGPLTRSVLDSAIIYDVIRGSTAGDRFRAEDPDSSFVAAVHMEPRRMRIGVSVAPTTRGVRPEPEHVAAVWTIANVLDSLGHQVEEVDPDYPDIATAFVPQFLGGVRAEADLVEDPRLLERRTRQGLRIGARVTPRVVEWSIRQGGKMAARANQIFDRCDILLTPVTPHRPPQVGMLDGLGFLKSAWRSQPATAYTALWNVTGNPAASVPAGIASDGLPLAVQLVARPHHETTILTLSAQLERERPWAHLRPGPSR